MDSTLQKKNVLELTSSSWYDPELKPLLESVATCFEATFSVKRSDILFWSIEPLPVLCFIITISATAFLTGLFSKLGTDFASKLEKVLQHAVQVTERVRRQRRTYYDPSKQMDLPTRYLPGISIQVQVEQPDGARAEGVVTADDAKALAAAIAKLGTLHEDYVRSKKHGNAQYRYSLVEGRWERLSK